MQTRRPNLQHHDRTHALLRRARGAQAGRGTSGVATALLAALTGCTGDPEPPAIDAALPGLIDAAPDAAVIDAAPIDAALPVQCTPAAPSNGPLCGPPEHACAVLVDATLPSPSSFRNDAPAVAVADPCQPQVSFSVAEGSFHGFHARLDPDGLWAVTGTPFPIATVAAVVAPGGAPVLLTDDGSFGVTLWKHDGVAGDWIERPVPGLMHANAAGMQRDSQGEVHAALRDSTGQVYHARLADEPDADWQLEPLGERTDARAVLALSPAAPGEVPHLAWWQADSAAGDWRLRWSPGAGNIETVAALGSSGLEIESQRHALAVGPADAANPAGRPHLLFARRRQSDAGVTALFYATRSGPDTWTTTLVDDSDVAGGSYCNHDPIQSGETCDVRTDALRPIGAVVGPAGDARLLYVEQHLDYTLSATCQPTPRGEHCEWRTSEDRSTAALYVAWSDGTGAVARAAVADVFLASTGTVALDEVGTMHVALYGNTLDANGQLVRYLRIGPSLAGP